MSASIRSSQVRRLISQKQGATNRHPKRHHEYSGGDWAEVVITALRCPVDLAAPSQTRSFDNFSQQHIPDIVAGSDTERHFTRYWQEAALRMDDEWLGLASRTMPLGSFHLVAQTVLRAPRLRLAIRRMLEFYRVAFPSLQGELIVAGEIAKLQISEEFQRENTASSKLMLLSILGLSRWLIDRNIVPITLEIKSGASLQASALELLFGCPVEDSDDTLTLSFPAHYLDFRPCRDERQLRRFMTTIPGSLIGPYERKDSLAASIGAILQECEFSDWPTFENLSQQLNTTPSTLRRRLDDERTTFQELKDNIRRDLAIKSLRKSEKSNSDIALDLGFEDPSTFYRAFKRWTGQTPSVYRAR